MYFRNHTSSLHHPACAKDSIWVAIYAEAVSFLTSQNIDEPVMWHPPPTLLEGLGLPGPDPSRVDLRDLHARVVHDGGSPGTSPISSAPRST